MLYSHCQAKRSQRIVITPLPDATSKRGSSVAGRTGDESILLELN